MVDLPSDTHSIHRDTHTQQVTMASGGSGSVVIGDYVVTRMLGSGSFAVVQYSPIAVVAPLSNWHVQAQLTLALRCTQVYKGHHKASGRVVAIKAISLAKLDKRALSNLESEISIMRRTRHPNIVRLLDIQVRVLSVFARGPLQPSHTVTLSTSPRILVQKSEKYIYLILEYCGGGDLSRLIRKKGPLSEQRTKELMRQLGTEQCHTTHTHTLLQLQRSEPHCVYTVHV